LIEISCLLTKITNGQRTQPKMALIETKIDYSSDMLFLSFSGMPTLQVNLRCSKESCEERISCSVWSSECIADVVAGGGE
jgi:hypothetical protein